MVHPVRSSEDPASGSVQIRLSAVALPIGCQLCLLPAFSPRETSPLCRANVAPQVQRHSACRLPAVHSPVPSCLETSYGSAVPAQFPAPESGGELARQLSSLQRQCRPAVVSTARLARAVLWFCQPHWVRRYRLSCLARLPCCSL